MYDKVLAARAEGKTVTSVRFSKIADVKKYNAKPIEHCTLVVQTAYLAVAREAHELGVPKRRITVKPSAASSGPAASDVQHESES